MLDATVGETGTDAAMGPYPDLAQVDPCNPSPCGPTELCGPTAADGGLGHGNGIDDNCNGLVDEGCPCDQSEIRPCFGSIPDRRSVGVCRDGTMRCTELGAWIGNECTGGVNPSPEVCNGLDDDCNGLVDDGLTHCVTTSRCPAWLGARPLENFTVDGRTIDPAATGFVWSLVCPDTVMPCPTVQQTTAPVVQMSLVSVGVYHLRGVLTDADGTTERCDIPVHVQGDGLRVEMDWDRKGGIASVGTDLDVHVSVIDRTTQVTRAWFSAGDCYFVDCKAPGGFVDWETSMTDTRFAPSADATACAGAPPPFGAVWQSAGHCWNPRLDTDTIVCDPSVTDDTRSTFCFPENAAVDEPPDNVTFRVMVNFYQDHGTCTDGNPANDVSHPVLSISCGGVLRGVVGSADDGIVGMRCGDNPGIGSANWSWLAADVRFVTNTCGVRDCNVTPLRAPVSRFSTCGTEPPTADVCEDTLGRVFVRNTADRPLDTEIPESP